MLRNIKQDIKNITLLLFIVGILSLIIYISVYANKEYTKNVNLDIETYNYKKSKDETIKLESVIPVKNYIIDMKFDGDNLLAISDQTISDQISNNKRGINIYNIDIHDKSITKVDTLTGNGVAMYNGGSISPSREVIVYDTVDSKKTDKLNSVIYNIEDGSRVTLDYCFNLLGWIPDSSGFYGYKKDELFLYNIDEQKITKKFNLNNNEYIDKIAFSQDGTKLYTLNISKDEICIYDLNSKLIKKIKSIKLMCDFEIIDDEHLIIETMNSSDRSLLLYNLKDNTKKPIIGMHLDEMYLSKDKRKLITVYYNGNNGSTIDIYDINLYNGSIDFYKLGSIPMIRGIPYVDVSDKNKLAYFIPGTNYNESEIYIYDIVNKK
ncbi:hypothetical protein [Paraclostridium tenue]|uniref:Uncharacterized protein n=1 Tax=Paraclostridium tenue TaxID=1737 RepID=A0ABN1LY59_9FIRM